MPECHRVRSAESGASPRTLRSRHQVSITRPRLRHRGRLPQNQTPAFQWYPRDWLTSRAVMKMTPTQRSYYFDLLCHAWLSDRPGFIPNDRDLLWRLARAKSRETFEREADLVLAQFRKGKNGELFHPRLVTERQRQARRTSEMSSRGKLGAARRWGQGRKEGEQDRPSTKNRGINNSFNFKSLDSTGIAQAMPSDGSASASASASAKSKSSKATTIDDLKKSYLAKCHDPEGVIAAIVEIVCLRAERSGIKIQSEAYIAKAAESFSADLGQDKEELQQFLRRAN